MVNTAIWARWGGETQAMAKKKQRHCVHASPGRQQMPSLDLPAATARMQAAAACDAVPSAAEADSVTIDIDGPVDGALAAEACVSEMSFCDLAGSVAPSDSASQVFSPRGHGLTMRNFDALHAAQGPVDDAFTAWKLVCEQEEAAARVQKKHDLLVKRLLREHAAKKEAPDEVGIQQLAQSVRNVEHSLAHLHLHRGTNFVEGRGPPMRKPAAQAIGTTPDAPQSFQSNTNANAPNMNRQHATGGRGRGRRHPNVG